VETSGVQASFPIVKVACQMKAIEYLMCDGLITDFGREPETTHVGKYGVGDVPLVRLFWKLACLNS